MEEQRTIKDLLYEKIAELFQDEDYGFEVFIALKNRDEQIKRFCIYDDSLADTPGFKDRIRDSISQTIKDVFLSDRDRYILPERLADEQDRIYIIPQDEEYEPFSYLKKSEHEIGNFSINDRNDSDGVVFRFRRGMKVLWAYQKIYPAAVPNKKSQNFLLKCLKVNDSELFTEMRDPLFTITKKVDILIVDNMVVTENIKLMQKHFKLETFIVNSALKAAESIAAINLVANSDKLTEYVKRSNRKYARRMMRISDYHVKDLKPEILLSRIQSVKRWNGVFDINEENRIQLRTYNDVENLIDLFDERYTVSEVTGDEFDTDVKKLAEPKQ